MAVKYNHRLVKLLTFKEKTAYLTSRPIKELIAFGLCMATRRPLSSSSVIHEVSLFGDSAFLSQYFLFRSRK